MEECEKKDEDKSTTKIYLGEVYIYLFYKVSFKRKDISRHAKWLFIYLRHSEISDFIQHEYDLIVVFTPLHITAHMLICMTILLH